MGVLKTLTDEYFGDSIREEDKIPIGDLDVEIVSFKDNNGKLHKNGYRVKDGDPDEMAKTLKTLIEKAIEVRGTECSLNDIDVSNQTKMCYEEYDEDEEYYIIGLFEYSDFNGDISGWDVSNVENTYCMFYYAKSFNGDISGWNVSSVKNMEDMFWYATSFNQDISGWDVSRVENMFYMFDETQLEKNNKLPKWYLDRMK